MGIAAWLLGTEQSELMTEVVACEDSTELLVEVSGRLVSRIVLAGLVSKNGYRYGEGALREAVPLYEGKPVYLDHGKLGREEPQRSREDLVGVIEGVVFEGGKVWGNIRVDQTTAGDLFLRLVDQQLPDVGMSHVVRAMRSRDGKVVERIVEVMSVDVVRFPATTTTFHEQESEDEVIHEICPMPDESGGVRQLDELTCRIEELERQRDRWKQEAETWRWKSEHAESVAAWLKESGLPEIAVTPAFRKMLLESRDRASCEGMIRERKALLRELQVVWPSSQSRCRVKDEGVESRLVAAIRGKSCVE